MKLLLIAIVLNQIMFILTPPNFMDYGRQYKTKSKGFVPLN